MEAVLAGEASWAIIPGDGVEVVRALPAASLDAVVADPPYARRHLALYEHLAAELPRALRRGGSFLAIVPHASLPQVLAGVGRHLKYRWTFCMWQGDGDHPRLAMGIEVLWKPVVWWVNGAWPNGRGFVKDGFISSQPRKAHHVWEQSLSWAEHCLRLVPPDGIVLDPLCGAGTVGVACLRTGRRFIGVERNERHVATAVRRLAAMCGGVQFGAFGHDPTPAETRVVGP